MNAMHYHHRFIVDAPLSEVAHFHSQSASMGAITPPPIVVQLHLAPPTLNDGDEMEFTMWLGPLPIRWRARIEQKSDTGFVDRQLSGPFAQWEHVHTFVSLDAEHTADVDQVTARLSSHWFWRFVGTNMWFGLPILFAYRGWKTRRMLGFKRNATPADASTSTAR